MAQNTLNICCFSSTPQEGQALVKKWSTKASPAMFTTDVPSPTSVVDAIAASNKSDMWLILLKPLNVLRSPTYYQLARANTGDKVLFPADVFYQYDDSKLHYFYWKHYPRPHEYYNFLNSSIFLGTTIAIAQLMQELVNLYPNAVDHSLNDLLHRYYVDGQLDSFKNDPILQVDHKQHLLGATRWSTVKENTLGWQNQFLHGINEKEVYTAANEITALNQPLNITAENSQLHHSITESRPLVVAMDQPPITKPMPAVHWLNFKAQWKTFKQQYKIFMANKGHSRAQEIFRFTKNRSENLNNATEHIVRRLEDKQPLSFAHYNDGELTFIKDYLAGNHNEKWFGRQQQKYDERLAERLHKAMQFQKEGYFVGIPCSTDHKPLHDLAQQVVGDYEYKIPAMAIHHNLAYMPRILHALKERNVFFFTNEYQDLSFFSSFGIKVKPEQVVQVPFKNSYLEYQKYHEMQFPDDAVVVLTCGMLAKILTHPWYENHERLTILALGSSLDDHIQPDNSNFELFPKKFPLTKNLHKSRAFLFGYKKRCKECYDMLGPIDPSNPPYEGN